MTPSSGIIPPTSFGSGVGVVSGVASNGEVAQTGSSA
jgi:hypothetical protein